MKEYKIQMRFESKCNGEWVHARQPWGGCDPHPYTDYKQAMLAMYRLEGNWEENSFGHEIPVEYRIISRKVTEWEPMI